MSSPDDRELKVPLDGGGCAAKIEPSTLKKLLSIFPASVDPGVLTRLQDFDDGVVYQLEEHLSIVFNVDYIAPNIADPFRFGQLAVGNALSDIYAKGARPLIAMNILGYPESGLPTETVQRVLAGGLETARQVGLEIVGGHSLNARSVFYGVAGLGLARSQDIVFNRNAGPGDHLVLTKALGVGAVTTGYAESALGVEPPSPTLLEEAICSMIRTNAEAAAVMREFKPTAATDVSGFGLIGHLCEMADASGVAARIRAEEVPMLDGVVDYVGSGYPFCSIQKNMTRYQDRVKASPQVPRALQRLFFDAQTSGGLLIAVKPSKSKELIQSLRAAGVKEAAVIGSIEELAGPPEHVCSLE